MSIVLERAWYSMSFDGHGGGGGGGDLGENDDDD